MKPCHGVKESGRLASRNTGLRKRSKSGTTDRSPVKLQMIIEAIQRTLGCDQHYSYKGVDLMNPLWYIRIVSVCNVGGIFPNYDLRSLIKMLNKGLSWKGCHGKSSVDQFVINGRRVGSDGIVLNEAVIYNSTWSFTSRNNDEQIRLWVAEGERLTVEIHSWTGQDD